MTHLTRCLTADSPIAEFLKFDTSTLSIVAVQFNIILTLWVNDSQNFSCPESGGGQWDGGNYLLATFYIWCHIQTWASVPVPIDRDEDHSKTILVYAVLTFDEDHSKTILHEILMVSLMAVPCEIETEILVQVSQHVLRVHAETLLTVQQPDLWYCFWLRCR